jgi:hypothetical protein
MSKKKEVKPKDKKNPNHKEDFMKILSMAAQPKKQVESK